MRHLVCICLLGLAVLSWGAVEAGEVKGQVVDGDTKEPLIGANVTVEGHRMGTSTGTDGRFVLEGLPLGTHSLMFSMIGYESQVRTDIVVRSGRATFVNAVLEVQSIVGEEVVATAGYYQKNGTELTSAVSFSSEELRRAPGAGQELSRILNAVPSVVSKGESSQDLLVRGGSPSENGFYVDNIFVPQVQHFVEGNGESNGPIGILNTEFSEDVQFYTGGFSAAYGDRLSSITDVHYREGNPEHLDLQFNLNFSGGGGHIEGPLSNGKGTWFVTGQRSYMDLIASAINTSGAPIFGDLQGKLVYDLNDRHRFTFLNIYGSSNFDRDREDALKEGFGESAVLKNRQNTLGVNWRFLWGKKGYSNTSVSYSFRTLDLKLTDTETGEETVAQDFRNGSAHLRNINFLQLSPVLKAEFGAELRVESGQFEYGFAPRINRIGVLQPGYDRQEEILGHKEGAFVSLIARPFYRWRTTLGVRMDYASFYKKYVFSPRFSTTYRITDRLSFNGAVGVFRQGLSLNLMAQNERNRKLDPVRADHYIAGLEYLLTPETRLTVEAFNKEYRHAPVISRDSPLKDPVYLFDLRNRSYFLDGLESKGEAYARGIEVMVQKKLARDFYGMVNGSFFRTRYKDFQGVWRDRTSDVRYLFSVIGGYKPNARWEVSARWSYMGGQPYTPIDEVRSRALNEEIVDLSRFNGARQPAYHSLFLRLDRRFNFQQHHLVMFMSLWNVYNRKNVVGYYWNGTEGRVDTEHQFSMLPVMGMEFEF